MNNREIRNDELLDFDYLIEATGYFLLENAMENEDISSIGDALIEVLNEENIKPRDGQPQNQMYQAIHFLLGRAPQFTELFCNLPGLPLVERCISDTCIVHSYSGVSLEPGTANHACKIHKDVPRHTGNYKLNMQILIFLYDFTKQNGAPWLLPGSHHVDGRPSDKLFEKNAKQITGKAGDVLIFDSQIWHRSGFNYSDKIRRGITVTFGRSYMRQQLDLVRAIPSFVSESLSEQGKRLIGNNVRVPTSENEYYLPLTERLYKPNQG